MEKGFILLRMYYDALVEVEEEYLAGHGFVDLDDLILNAQLLRS